MSPLAGDAPLLLRVLALLLPLLIALEPVLCRLPVLHSPWGPEHC